MHTAPDEPITSQDPKDAILLENKFENVNKQIMHVLWETRLYFNELSKSLRPYEGQG